MATIKYYVEQSKNKHLWYVKDKDNKICKIAHTEADAYNKIKTIV